MVSPKNNVTESSSSLLSSSPLSAEVLPVPSVKSSEATQAVHTVYTPNYGESGVLNPKDNISLKAIESIKTEILPVPGLLSSSQPVESSATSLTETHSVEKSTTTGLSSQNGTGSILKASSPEVRRRMFSLPKNFKLPPASEGLSSETSSLSPSPSSSPSSPSSSPLPSSPPPKLPTTSTTSLPVATSLPTSSSSVSTSVTSLASIRALANTPGTSTTPAQSVLKDMLSQFSNIEGFSGSAKIEARLKEELGANQLETFMVGEQTCYKIDVDYIVTGKINGKDESITLKRTIYTTATDPKQAILAASSFKNVVVQLAQAGENVDNPDRLVCGKDDVSKAMLQSTFSFKFKDVSGKPTVESIQAGKGLPFTFKFKPTSDSYVYDNKSAAPKLVNKNEIETLQLQGKKIYPSEEEALSSVAYNVKEHDLYARLSKQPGAILKHISKVKEDISTTKKEFDHVKSSFREEPLFKFFGQAKKPEEYERFIANIDNVVKGGTPPAGLSSNMQNYLAIKKELKGFQDKYGTDSIQKLQDELKKLESIQAALKQAPAMDVVIDTGLIGTIREKYTGKVSAPSTDKLAVVEECIKLKTHEIVLLSGIQNKAEAAKNAITEEQTAFNDKLMQLQKLNRDLSGQVAQLEQLQTSAQSNKPPDERTLKAIPSQLQALKEQVQKNQKLIKEIIDRLPSIGAEGGVNLSTEIQVSESPPPGALDIPLPLAKAKAQEIIPPVEELISKGNELVAKKLTEDPVVEDYLVFIKDLKDGLQLLEKNESRFNTSKNPNRQTISNLIFHLRKKISDSQANVEPLITIRIATIQGVLKKAKTEGNLSQMLSLSQEISRLSEPLRSQASLVPKDKEIRKQITSLIKQVDTESAHLVTRTIAKAQAELVPDERIRCDGSCLFSSIHRQIERNTNSDTYVENNTKEIAEYRHLAISHIETNRSQFQAGLNDWAIRDPHAAPAFAEYITRLSSDIQIKLGHNWRQKLQNTSETHAELENVVWDFYQSYMIKPNSWGGTEDITALSEQLKTPIVVFSQKTDGSNTWALTAVKGYPKFQDQPPVLVYYKGESHYQSLQPKNP